MDDKDMPETKRDIETIRKALSGKEGKNA